MMRREAARDCYSLAAFELLEPAVAIIAGLYWRMSVLWQRVTVVRGGHALEATAITGHIPDSPTGFYQLGVE